VLNTSFIVMGQPSVESPSEAIHGFLATDIDSLAIGDFLLDKPTSGRWRRGALGAGRCERVGRRWLTTSQPRRLSATRASSAARVVEGRATLG